MAPPSTCSRSSMVHRIHDVTNAIFNHQRRRPRSVGAAGSVGRAGRRSGSRCGRRSRTSSTGPGPAPTAGRRRGRRRGGSRGRAARSRTVGGSSRRSMRQHGRRRPRWRRPRPRPCPVTPLVDVTGGPGSPKTLLIARASARSLSGVDVPWALMWAIGGRLEPGVEERQLHAGDRAGAVGRGGGDVVGVGGAGRAGDLRVDAGATGDGAVPASRGRAHRRLRPSRSRRGGRRTAGTSPDVDERGHVGERGDRDGVHTRPRRRRRWRRRSGRWRRAGRRWRSRGCRPRRR